MKAAAFAYARAETLTHALDLLERHGDGAKLIAGGQSLVPALNLRLMAPDILIDISRLGELRGVVALEGGGLSIGGLTRYADLLASAEVAVAAPLLVEALHHVAHPAIRNRGTIGGNLAHADPASELPACMVALEAVLVVTGKGGERRIPAEEFFQGPFTTALAENEILTAVEIPAASAGQRTGFHELARRPGDYAIAGLACRLVPDAAGAISDLRLVYFAVGDRPVLATGAASRLVGRPFTPAALAEARGALAEDLEPQEDLQASGAMRLHLAGVLLERVLGAMMPGAETEGRLSA